jgi:ribonuclease HI
VDNLNRICVANPFPHVSKVIFTTNNEMELQAIAEALEFLPKDFKGYVVIETDSKGCLDTMMGLGRRWQIDNYVNLKGNRVKNRSFVDRIVNRLKSLHADYRKVVGHSGDQWNDRADQLAVQGRDEAASWPQCSFELTMPNAVKIPFRTRSTVQTPLSWHSSAYSNPRHMSICHRHVNFVFTVPTALSSRALAPDPADTRPATFGVFNGVGVSFTPTRPMDCSKIPMSRMISEFNRAVRGFGDAPRFFIGTTEVDPTALVPGQPYSVYPKVIKRPNENRAQLGGAAQPPRIEGPFINIQWKVTDGFRNPLCLPGHSLVPEEISLLQLFKIFIAAKNRIAGIQIMWGDHYRGETSSRTEKSQHWKKEI